MKTILILGTSIVNLALISYSIAVITEQRRHALSSRVLVFLSMGLVLDITATILMIIGSENPAFTLHGLIGYSSLTGMLIDAILLCGVCGLRTDCKAAYLKASTGIHALPIYGGSWPISPGR